MADMMVMLRLDLQLTRLRMRAGGRPGWSNLSTILNRIQDDYDQLIMVVIVMFVVVIMTLTFADQDNQT